MFTRDEFNAEEEDLKQSGRRGEAGRVAREHSRENNAYPCGRAKSASQYARLLRRKDGSILPRGKKPRVKIFVHHNVASSSHLVSSPHRLGLMLQTPISHSSSRNPSRYMALA